MERYRQTIGADADRALGDDTNALNAIATLLRESALLFSRASGAPGCIVTTAPAGVLEDALTLFGRQFRAEGVEKLTVRLEQGMRDGQLRSNTDCPSWARYISAVLQGMSVQACYGAPTASLVTTADIAIRSLDLVRSVAGIGGHLAAGASNAE